MFLKSLDIVNFKSFYGKHSYDFKRGINIVHGECGAGKTNLCKAIEFTLFGDLWGGIEHPVNFMHEQEQREKDKLPSAEITLEIVVDEEVYLIERSISISDSRSSRIPSDRILRVYSLTRFQYRSLARVSTHFPGPGVSTIFMVYGRDCSFS